jgi:hypothetical protein
MACCAISKDWPLTSNRRFGVSASTRVATVMPCSLRGFASRQHTTKEAVPSFFLRFRMLATQKTVRRCQHFGRFCQHPKTQQAPDLQKHCARGGTRTAFQTLNFRYFPENLRNPAQSASGTTRSEAQGVHTVHTLFLPTSATPTRLLERLSGKVAISLEFDE